MDAPSTRWLVRVARPEDAAACAAIYAPLVEHTPWLCAVDDEAVIGYAYAGRHRERAAYRWSVDVSVYVHERARGRGVGARLYAELLALHRSAGFEPVGVYRRVGWKFGHWHDTGWYGRPIGPETETPPTDPVPFPQL